MFSLMASLAVFGSSFVYCGDLAKAMAAMARFIFRKVQKYNSILKLKIGSDHKTFKVHPAG